MWERGAGEADREEVVGRGGLFASGCFERRNSLRVAFFSPKWKTFFKGTS